MAITIGAVDIELSRFRSYGLTVLWLIVSPEVEQALLAMLDVTGDVTLRALCGVSVKVEEALEGEAWCVAARS